MPQSITITARQWRDLIGPVLPCAGRDDMLPILSAIEVRTDGKWLIATATDRFRVAMKRIAKVATDDDLNTEWPEFYALIPLKAVRSILSTTKTTRGYDPAMTFTAKDANTMVVEAAGAFDLFDSAGFTHTILSAEYPKVASLIRDALALPAEERVASVSVNMDYLAEFKAVGPRSTLRILLGLANKPLVVTDDNGFIGALMPRRAESEPESWDDVLAPKPEPEAKPARKSRAKKVSA